MVNNFPPWPWSWILTNHFLQRNKYIHSYLLIIIRKWSWMSPSSLKLTCINQTNQTTWMFFVFLLNGLSACQHILLFLFVCACIMSSYLLSKQWDENGCWTGVDGMVPINIKGPAKAPSVPAVESETVFIGVKTSSDSNLVLLLTNPTGGKLFCFFC